tara:strand:+ start:563 stop:838 length:276 start_codon:yes stop_codon:yes gene_type:complete
MKKMVNGVVMDMTAEEISAFNLRTQISFEEAMQDLRNKRNNLLAETDYLALSDQTLSADMNTYRQQLRDITNGLTTVEEVEAVVFPTKPGA